MNSAYFLEKTGNLISKLFIAEGDASRRVAEYQADLEWVLHLEVPKEQVQLQKKVLALLLNRSNRNSSASKFLKQFYILYHNVKNAKP